MIGMGLAAGGRDLGDRGIEPLAIVVDCGDASSFPRHDIGGRPTNTTRRCRAEGDLTQETHALAPPDVLATLPCLLRHTLHCLGRGSKGSTFRAPLICAAPAPQVRPVAVRSRQGNDKAGTPCRSSPSAT